MNIPHNFGNIRTIEDARRAFGELSKLLSDVPTRGEMIRAIRASGGAGSGGGDQPPPPPPPGNVNDILPREN